MKKQATEESSRYFLACSIYTSQNVNRQPAPSAVTEKILPRQRRMINVDIQIMMTLTLSPKLPYPRILIFTAIYTSDMFSIYTKLEKPTRNLKLLEMRLIYLALWSSGDSSFWKETDYVLNGKMKSTFPCHPRRMAVLALSCIWGLPVCSCNVLDCCLTLRVLKFCWIG